MLYFRISIIVQTVNTQILIRIFLKQFKIAFLKFWP